MKESDFIKNSGLTDTEISLLREQFIVTFVRQKGWDLTSLTNEQLAELKEQKGYKTPGLILG
jgi:hypothetical protein